MGAQLRNIVFQDPGTVVPVTVMVSVWAKRNISTATGCVIPGMARLLFTHHSFGGASERRSGVPPYGTLTGRPRCGPTRDGNGDDGGSAWMCHGERRGRRHR